MARKKYKGRNTSKTKPSGIAKLIRFIFILLILVIVVAYLGFRNWGTKLNDETDKNSVIVSTSMGPIHYVSQGEGPVILLSHMEGSGSDNVKLFKKLTEAGFKIICPSRPGYLKTPLAQNTDFKYQSELFAELLHVLKIDQKVVMLGISAGGPAAIEFAKKYPDKCSDLILINSPADKLFETSQIEAALFPIKVPVIKNQSDIYSWILWQMARYNSKMIISKIIEASTAGSNSEVDQLINSLKNNVETKNDIINYLGVISPIINRRVGVMNDLKNLKLYEKNDQRLRMPTLIIQSKTDKTIDFSHAEKIKDDSRNAEIFAYSGSGHAYWFNEDLNLISSKIIDFLDKKIKHPGIIANIQDEGLYGITWVNKSDGALLQIMEDGNFTLDFPSVDSKQFIKGKVSVVDHQISFLYNSDVDFCPEVAGIYEFTIKDGQLELKVLNDGCKTRANHFSQGWFKV